MMKTKAYHQLSNGALLLAFPLLTCFSCIMNPEARTEPRSEITASALPSAVPTNTGIGQGTSKKKIKIALLLDTSNSMDGLIDQAKSQLWKLVNQLAGATCNNEKPQLEIALYEYGNDRLSGSEGYIRQVSMFTDDLDLISENLFGLTTNGGSEFCGQVIHTSLKQLDWGADEGDLRIIFIAGNEEFTQGPIGYKKSCSTAKEKDVIVNTIFCGNFEEGLNTGWKNGAVLTSGEYMSIEQDRKTIYIETPYDAEIAKLNDKLNGTYVAYGKMGTVKLQSQATQDANAATYGAANTTERTVSKSSSFYNNYSWDLVDASKDKNFKVEEVKEEELPAQLKGKSKEEKQKYIEEKNSEREKIKAQIAGLNIMRIKYIAQKEKEMGKDINSLDAAMVKAIKQQASKKNFVFI